MNKAPTPTQLVAQRSKAVMAYLDREAIHKQIAAVVPVSMAKTLAPDRYIRLAMVAIGKNDRLQQSTHESILSSVIQLATWGLEPSGATGEAYLVPYRKKGIMECQPQVGYKGYITLAKRSGHIRSIWPNLVYQHDEFRMNLGDDEPPYHNAAWDEDERGSCIGGYAVARFTDGGIYKIRMSLKEINRIRDKSPGYSYTKSGPWKDNWEEMAKKTLIRRCSKGVPLSPELAEVFAAEDAQDARVEELKRGQIIDVEPMPDIESDLVKELLASDAEVA